MLNPSIDIQAGELGFPIGGIMGGTQTIEYEEFLKQKTKVNFDVGFEIEEININPILYDFQKAKAV